MLEMWDHWAPWITLIKLFYPFVQRARANERYTQQWPWAAVGYVRLSPLLQIMYISLTACDFSPRILLVGANNILTLAALSWPAPDSTLGH